jgi:adenine-specific DNA-methyltransferase
MAEHKTKRDKDSKKSAGAPVALDTNLLFHGDNLEALAILLDTYSLKGKIDLVYIDPPFATNSHFTIGDSRVSTISKSMRDPVAYSDKLVGPEFLEFLRSRLVLLRELMSDTASIYLHIDYKIGHYVKVLMDEVFGINNFRNDITRIKCNPKNFQRKAYGNIKDMILFYTKTDAYTWHDPHMPLREIDRKTLFKKTDAAGRRYTTVPLHAPGETTNGPTGKPWRGMKPPEGRHWRSDPAILEELDKAGLIEWSVNGVPRKKIYEDERTGKKAQDIWEFKDPQYPTYPTEKNLELLTFIVGASSNENDIVLDCFSGSGTTLVAAQALGRRWVGIDNSAHAVRVAEKRLDAQKPELFIAQREYDVIKLASNEPI